MSLSRKTGRYCRLPRLRKPTKSTRSTVRSAGVCSSAKPGASCTPSGNQHRPSHTSVRRSASTTSRRNTNRTQPPSGAPWLSEYINELTSFPGARHDDQVDSTTQALDHLRTNEGRNWFKFITPEVLAQSRIPRYPYNRFRLVDL